MDCKICFEKYDINLRKPISINCGHSFCNDCLNSLRINNSYVCPTCRRPITNEEPNYTVLDILETFNLENESNRESLLVSEVSIVFNEIEERKKKVHSKCRQQLIELKNKFESIKSTISCRADELINRIKSRQEFLIREADTMQRNLSEKIASILDENRIKNQSQVDFEKIEKRELEKLKVKYNQKIQLLKSNQNELHQIENLFEFKLDIDDGYDIGSFTDPDFVNVSAIYIK